MCKKNTVLKFEEKFMKSIYSNDKKLNKFLSSNFYIINPYKLDCQNIFKKIFTRDSKMNRHEQYQVNDKVDLLKKLSDGEKKVAKARLKQLEEDNDVTKFSSVQLVILAGLFVMLKSDVVFRDENNQGVFWWVLFIVILSILFGYLYVVFTSTAGRNYRKTAIYCNSLLEDVLTVEKETVTEDDK